MKSYFQRRVEEILKEALENVYDYFPVEETVKKICDEAFEYYREDMGR